jgi:hypothetical protein
MQYGDNKSKTLVEEARSLSHILQQLNRPGTDLYFPVRQAAHTSISLPVSRDVSYPALQRHAVFAVLISGEYKFTGHTKQDVIPITDLYVFCGHEMQILLSVTV